MDRIAAFVAAASGRRGLQAIAVAIAVCLTIPLAVSISLAQTMGYALFGYEPAQCGQRTDSVQTINGDNVRVCQHPDAAVSTFVPGGDGTRASTFFYLGLPGQGTEPNEGLEFSCCSIGENAYGRFVPFVDNAFGPLTGTDPLNGTTTMTAAYAGQTYATVSQTSTVSLASLSYVTTYAVTNVSGSAMLVRPFAETDGFGAKEAVSFSADTGANTYKITNPLIGGSVTLASSNASGSPAVARFQAGSGQSLYVRPGRDLDDTVHALDGYEAMSGSALAVQWADHTSTPLASGATAYYSVRVTIEPPRSVHLALHDPATPPTRGATTNIDIEARGFTPSAGTPLVWRTYGAGAAAQNFSGTLGLDSAGRARVSIPPFTGNRTFTAYVDRNANGHRDDDEPEQYASLWIPRDGSASGGGSTDGGTTTSTQQTPATGGSPSPAAAPAPVTTSPAGMPPAGAPRASPGPSISGPSKVKASQLGKGLGLTLSHLKPRSALTLTARLKTKPVGSAKGKADAKGTAKLKLKIATRTARRLSGKKLQLRFTVVTAAGARATVTRQLTVG
jgi:hypothetical protein